jgi:hypothetical protein
LNYRWIVGGKISLLVNQDGLVVAWDSETANVCNNKFQPMVKEYEDEMIVLSDEAFNAREGDPKNLKVCKRGTWNVRMIIETTFSMITLISHFKKKLMEDSALLMFADYSFHQNKHLALP